MTQAIQPYGLEKRIAAPLCGVAKQQTKWFCVLCKRCPFLDRFLSIKDRSTT